MNVRIVSVLLLLMVGGLAACQDKVFVRFPAEGTREVWVQTGLPGEPPSDQIRTSKESVELPISGKKDTDAIFVWDKTTGNLASKTVGEVKKARSWMVDAAAYQDIAEVVVQVQSNGKPVGAANVSLNDGRRTQRQLIDPSSNGEARFFAIKPGSLKVTVEYKADGKTASPVTQILAASLKRNDAVPTMAVALPGNVAATPAAGDEVTPAGSEKAATDTAPPTNVFGAIIAYLAALAIAVGVGYVAFRFIKQNPDQVGSKLEQLGVQIPKPGDDDLQQADPVVPAPARPEPPQKIILDDAAPTPATAAPVMPVSTGVPRLVAENGDVLDLDEGELTVGREVGLGVSLVGESTVSRRHAVIRRSGSTATVADLGSTNGTYVNGAKVDGETELRPGDAVQFGSVRFRYEG